MCRARKDRSGGEPGHVQAGRGSSLQTTRRAVRPQRGHAAECEFAPANIGDPHGKTPGGRSVGQGLAEVLGFCAYLH